MQVHNDTEQKSVIVIGAGLGGLSAAAYLAHAGYAVTVIEQLPAVGGRAQVWQEAGWRFDLGPSWYWMPQEHDAWFEKLGLKREHYYDITRLDPSFKVFFDQQSYRVPAGEERVGELFETIEAGGGQALSDYLALCKRRYEVGMRHFIYKSYRSIWEMASLSILRHWRTVRLLRSYQDELQHFFHNDKLQKILTYPVVFLGSDAAHTPAIYTMMNWVDIGLGTWYPQGGFSAVAEGMRRAAEQLGVRFVLSQRCIGFHFKRGRNSIAEVVCVPTAATELVTGDEGAANAQRLDDGAGSTDGGGNEDGNRHLIHRADVIVANGDYPAMERLLPSRLRSYSARYWRRRALSPAVLNFYLGLDTIFDELDHHSFFFDGDWDAHFTAVYRKRTLIEKPLFYIHYPSGIDPNTAPKGCSALFILIPIAPKSKDTKEIRERYFTHCCERIQQKIGRDIRPHIRVKRSMSITEFEQAYSAFQGNAFGLGHTLWQTAGFRPRNKSRCIDNLYYCGQYTVPGTGTTMSTISGEIVTDRIVREHGRGDAGGTRG